MNQGLIYLKIILIFIIVYSINKLFFVNEVKVVEHFGNPLAAIGKIFKSIVNFLTNILDILLVLLELMEGIIFAFAIIFDLIIMLMTWFHPMSMIKSVISTTFMFVKMIILMLFDFFYHYFRVVSEFLISFIKGGLWGLPHGPEQHRSFDDMLLGEADRFGDHVHTIGHAAAYQAQGDKIVRDEAKGGGNIYQPHHTAGGTGDGIDWFEDYQLYRPLRCYKNIGANGYMNIFATIICPPLGVFMSYGMAGWAKIGLCAILCLAMYFPGLVYALLITAHRGLPGEITAKDCGPVFKFGQHFYPHYGGVIIKGCTARLTKDRCTSATIPGYESEDGGSLNACEWITDFDTIRQTDAAGATSDDNYRLNGVGEDDNDFFIDPEAVGGEETNDDNALSSDDGKNTPFAETLINNMKRYGGVCVNRNVDSETPANFDWQKVAEI